MSRSKLWVTISLLIVATMILTACAQQAAPTPEVVVKTVVVEGTPNVVVATSEAPAATKPPAAPAQKVLRMSAGASDLPTIDPSMATDVNNIQVIEELSVGLVRQNVQTAELEPGMATEWKVSPDGMVYTFTIRDNVPWVRYDALKNQVVNVLDCEGKPRMVKAQDFDYGIRRTLNPATASDYAYVLTPVIKGALDYNDGTAKDDSGVGVKAIDDKTLEITFVAPAAYNLNIAGLWVAHAQPKWIIDGDDCTEGRGEKWTETGFHQSYGPFAMKEWVHDSYISLVKNPLWPGTTNIPVAKLDELRWRFLDASATLAEFEAGNMETSGVPSGDYERIMTDPNLKSLITYTSTLGTEFYSFNTQLAPTDDARVRRALSMSIDRETLTAKVVKSGKPALYFTNPGVAGAPKPDKYPDLGIKYDPTAAKALMDEYLKEKNTTADKLTVVLMFNTSESSKNNAEAIANMWKTTLGINTTIQNQERKVYLQTRKAGKEQIYRSSWVQDYPDANNFLFDVFGPGGGYAEVVDWKGPAYDKFVETIKKAAVEADPDKRMALYADAEKILVVDEAVIAPLYWYNTPVLVAKNVQYLQSITGYDRFEFWDITQ